MRLRAAAAVLLALGAAACGRPPPQAPPAQTTELNDATTAIASACGEAAEVTAFPGEHRRALAPLERRAAAAGRTLASVLHRNPAWIYEGADVRELVADSLSMLRTCRLGSAAAALARDARASAS
jgi:hypothetical protein